MKKMLVFLSLVVAFSCGSKQREVKLFNNVSFEIAEGEKEISTSLLYPKYESFLNKRNLQIPLFKCIVHTNYSVYIGIPYQLSFEEYNAIPLDSVQVIENKSDSVSYSFKKYLSENQYTTEYMLKQGEDVFYILAVTPDQDISSRLLTQENLFSRFLTQK